MDLGLRRSRTEMLPVVGAARSSIDGLRVQFSLDVEDDVIAGVSFRASFCSALIAYCELLAERSAGSTLRRAARIGFADLIRALPGVPPGKHDRARLALSAWWSAIAEAQKNRGE